MFTLARSAQFGQDTTSTDSTDQPDPATLTIGNILADAESKLKQAFNKFQLLSVSAPNGQIDAGVLARYGAARDAFVQSAQAWADARNQTPKDQLPDPDAQPTFPPEIGVLSTSGFGAAGPGTPIPFSQIVVKYGPVGQQKVSGLAASLYDPYFARYYARPATNGLGGWPLLILIGVAIVGATVILVTKFVTAERGSVEVARSDAERSNALSAQTQQELRTLSDLSVKCIGTSTDPTVAQGCINSAQTAVRDVLAHTPTTQPSSGPSGGGVLAFVGVVALVALVSIGGYMIYKRTKGEGAHGGGHADHEDDAYEDDGGYSGGLGAARRRRRFRRYAN
jgi:hypothetical protein